MATRKQAYEVAEAVHYYPEETRMNNTQTLRFDAVDLNARVDGRELCIDIPMLSFRGDILSETAREDLREAGLSAGDIDTALEEMLDSLNTKVLAALLMRNRK